jgi:hypothetical protein
LALLASIDTLYSSIATLAKNVGAPPTWYATPDGMWHLRREADWLRKHGGSAAVFAELLRRQIEQDFIPPSGSEFKMSDPATPGSRFEDLRAIVQLALRDDVDLRIVLAPVHAMLLEARRAAGLEAEYERWVRTIVRLVAAECSHRGAARDVPVWDFGGYNAITTEELPAAGSSDSMRWYIDPVHYRREVGDQVLERIFRGRAAAEPLSEPFGVQLTATNVERALANTRAAGGRYRASHAPEIASLENVARAARERRERRRNVP